ncbi:hypothetical protein [Candidatus Methanomassiliicoccus intestinalis]|uniref:hypothetical protein n=1 Tax=Candidatus Methanomassiliicoccus intestinalis TaxID=1406512 RepID=UPI0037DD7D78
MPPLKRKVSTLNKPPKKIGEHMNKKSKLILASALLITALMLFVPLTQVDMPGGGGTGNLSFRLNHFE